MFKKKKKPLFNQRFSFVSFLVQPKITYLNNQTASEFDDQVTLTCEASGDPTPTISWSFENRVFTEGEQVLRYFSFLFLSKVDLFQTALFISMNKVNHHVLSDRPHRKPAVQVVCVNSLSQPSCMFTVRRRTLVAIVIMERGEEKRERSSGDVVNRWRRRSWTDGWVSKHRTFYSGYECLCHAWSRESSMTYFSLHDSLRICHERNVFCILTQTTTIMFNIILQGFKLSTA